MLRATPIIGATNRAKRGRHYNLFWCKDFSLDSGLWKALVRNHLYSHNLKHKKAADINKYSIFNALK